MINICEFRFLPQKNLNQNILCIIVIHSDDIVLQLKTYNNCSLKFDLINFFSFLCENWDGSLLTGIRKC